jgi:hypothetical protein
MEIVCPDVIESMELMDIQPSLRSISTYDFMDYRIFTVRFSPDSPEKTVRPIPPFSEHCLSSDLQKLILFQFLCRHDFADSMISSFEMNKARIYQIPRY